jgi:hypothetical protein
MTYYKIIHTDNFGRDYPDERFVSELPALTQEQANLIANTINSCLGPDPSRYYLSVPDDYVLQPGFEP